MRLDRLNIQSINPQSSDILNFFWGSSPGLTREVFEMVFFDIEEIGGVDGFVLLSGATLASEQAQSDKTDKECQ